MEFINQLQLIFALVIFLTVVIMNVAKKNNTLVTSYLIQSVMLVTLLGIKAFHEASFEVGLVAAVLFFIKVIIAPQVLRRVLHRSKAHLSASTYLNVPMTLLSMILLCIFAQSDIFSPFASLTPPLRILLIGGMLISFFLTINRKGAISQIVGVLSLENCIFAFGYFLGLEQSAALEIGMLFDVFFWLIISSIFVRMILTHYGTLDVTELKALKK
jgi:hydrogenase-4 component E